MIDPSKGRLALAQALAKRRLQKRVRKEDRQLGTGTNERGPPVSTNYPPNAFPSDGDHD
jgi:hypothetical protein